MPESQQELDDIRSMSDLLTPVTVRLAATLKIADHIAAGRQSSQQIAEAEELNQDTLQRILAHMASIGLLEPGPDGTYTLTSRGEVLRDDHPSGYRAMLDMTRALGRAELSFVNLLHCVRSGAAAYQKQYGVPLWYDLETSPELRESYNQEMSIDVSTWAPAIIEAVDWGQIDSVLDVGGGDGTLLIQLLNAFPALRGGVLDLPGTARAAEEKLKRANVSHRAEAVAGSFFDQLPSGYDGYILTAIVHDWDDPDAQLILKRCADAAGDSGRVFVVEKIGTDGATVNTAMDLRLLAYLGGRERSLPSLIALCEGAGLNLVTVHRAGAISILELTVSAGE